MRLRSVHGYRLHIPFTTDVSHSLFTRTETEALVVRVAGASGLQGYGEGTPRSYVTGETLAGCIDALRLLAPELLDRGQDDRQDPLEFLHSVSAGDTAQRHPACWCALETAVLDLWGKETGSPLWRLFASQPAAREFTYSAVLPLMPDHKSLLKVVELVKKRRIFFVKAKVGDRRSGVETLHVLRSELGPQANIRVDANGAFSAWEALTFLAEVEPFTISALEQPVPKHELAALGEVSRRSGVPVFADESLCTLQDAAYLIENDLCTGFNLRLTKCGGFLRSLAMRDLARRHGVIWQLGCHVGETAILSAAGRHMAALGGDCAYLEGSFSRYVLREDLSVEDLTFGPGGLAPLLSGPGLGVTIDDSTLSRWSEPVVSLPQR